MKIKIWTSDRGPETNDCKRLCRTTSGINASTCVTIAFVINIGEGNEMQHREWWPETPSERPRVLEWLLLSTCRLSAMINKACYWFLSDLDKPARIKLKHFFLIWMVSIPLQRIWNRLRECRQTTHMKAHKIFILLAKNGRGEIRNYVAKNFQTFSIFPHRIHKIIFYYKSQHIWGGEIFMCAAIPRAKNDGDFNANLHWNPPSIDGRAFSQEHNGGGGRGKG